MDDSPISFSWIYFICRAKLNLDKKESGRLTYNQFISLYRAYQDTFDLELILTSSHTTYAQLKAEAEKSEEWLN